mmetsp:Transcript_38039/g.80991  ORF Transcript_38039/g.80991 Transcript_38039/m.80991 type:complete len:197 (-) Transcript_38039:405-995(-)
MVRAYMLIALNWLLHAAAWTPTLVVQGARWRRADLHCCDCGPLPQDVWARVLSVAGDEAGALGLKIESIAFQGGKLRVLASGGSIDDLQVLNSRLSSVLDDPEVDETMPPFLLEVSSPGVSNELSSDVEFTAWKGFEVIVTTSEEFKKKLVHSGTLLGRDAEFISLNQKGRVQKIPRDCVASVTLPTARTEPGDRG